MSDVIKKIYGSMNLDSFNLTIRTANCLKIAEIFTLNQLLQYNELDLLKFKTFGRKSVNELNDILQSFNLKFGDKIENDIENSKDVFQNKNVYFEKFPTVNSCLNLKEQRALAYRISGQTYEHIAFEMGISKNYARHIVESAYKKLRAPNKMHLSEELYKLGIYEMVYKKNYSLNQNENIKRGIVMNTKEDYEINLYLPFANAMLLHLQNSMIDENSELYNDIHTAINKITTSNGLNETLKNDIFNASEQLFKYSVLDTNSKLYLEHEQIHNEIKGSLMKSNNPYSETIIGVETIMEELLKAGIKPEQMDHNASDLYVEKNEISEAVMENYASKSVVQTFTSNIDKKTNYLIPFAYQPAWDKSVSVGEAKTAPGLPRMCYSIHEETGNPIMLVRGESGYKEALYISDVEAANKGLGVNKAQEKAMFIGSMFGWNVPGADPKNQPQEPVENSINAEKTVATIERGNPDLGITRHNVGDKVEITIDNMRIMTNGHFSVKAYPSESYLKKCQNIFENKIEGEITHTFPPGYEVTAKFGEESFNMKDNYITNLTQKNILSDAEFRKLYKENTELNLHGENVVLLAERYGNKQQIECAKHILSVHEKTGYLAEELQYSRDNLEKELKEAFNRKPKFNVGDKVDFVNDYGVAFLDKTIKEIEIKAGEPTRYHYVPTETPWFATEEKHLSPRYENPKLTKEETTAYVAFVEVMKRNYPDIKVEDVNKLCGIAYEMGKCNQNQSSENCIPTEKFNEITDRQEVQIESILKNLKPNSVPKLDYEPRGAAIKLQLPQGHYNTLGGFAVPEIPIQKLTIKQEATIAPVQEVSKKR